MPFTERQLTKRLGAAATRETNTPGRKGAHGAFGNKVPTRIPDTLRWDCGCVAKPGFNGMYDLALCETHTT